jgi:hypothetical protein
MSLEVAKSVELGGHATVVLGLLLAAKPCYESAPDST